jgi:hypothetical protein
MTTTTQMQNEIIEIYGQRWKVREAATMQDALHEIAHAAVRGSIGGKTVSVRFTPDRTETVLSDVVRLNADGSEYH